MLTPPKFPQLKDIVDPATFELVETPTAPTRGAGLFDVLLAGHIETLAQDVLEHPAKYEEELRPLIEEIIEGRKSLKDLTPGEKTLLDRGTLDFATYVPPKEEAPIKTAARKKRPEAEEDVDFDEGTPAPGLEDADVDLPAFWWK